MLTKNVVLFPVKKKDKKNNLDQYLDFVMNDVEEIKNYEESETDSSFEEAHRIDDSKWPNQQYYFAKSKDNIIDSMRNETDIQKRFQNMFQ